MQRKLAEAHHLDGGRTRYLSTPWINSIGHISLLDFFAKKKILGLPPGHNYVVLASEDQVANRCYLDYWRPYFEIISDPAQIASLSGTVRYLEDQPAVVPLYETLMWLPSAIAIVQKQWESEQRPPLLMLSEAHRERGWRALQDYGVPRDTWFACLHVREGTFGLHQTDRTRTRRNADIETYMLCVKTVVSRGGWVVRMGDPSMKALPPMAQVIDYAHSQLKNDWMDVFLSAQCRFFIGTNSGLCWVASAFGVPCALTNWAPLGIQSHYGENIFIPQLLWSNKERRYLTFAEQLSAPFGHAESDACLASHDVSVLPNTPEEIEQVAVELMQRLEGTFQPQESYSYLQEQFVKLSEAAEVYGSSAMGHHFLLKYADLLK